LFGAKFLQPIHASVPKLLVFQNPPRHISQRLWGQLKGVVTTVMGPSDEPNLLEHFHVLAKRGQGHRKWRSNNGYACRPTNVATVAYANKLARIAWAIMMHGNRYNPALAFATIP